MLVVVLEITDQQWLQMVAETFDRKPLEACGLLIGEHGGDRVERFVPVHNEAESATIYRLDGAEYLAATLAAERDGLDLIGVMHSHPTTAAYPSPTDVDGATHPMIPPDWHWVIVSLAAGLPELRSYRIVDGRITEERVSLR